MNVYDYFYNSAKLVSLIKQIPFYDNFLLHGYTIIYCLAFSLKFVYKEKLLFTSIHKD